MKRTMTQKTRKRISFNLFLSPDGTVEQFSDSHVAMIRRIAEEMFELPGGGMITMSTDVNATVGKGLAGNLYFHELRSPS